MLRYTLLTFFILLLAGYAWRDWYKSLCGLIFLMAFIEHPSMPKSMFGIPGFNLWNLLLVVIVMAFMAQRKKEGLTWDLPKHLTWLLGIYISLIFISYIRLGSDGMAGIAEYSIVRGKHPPSKMSLLSDYIINCFKWVVPGILLFIGCRTEERVRWAVFSVGLIYFMLALQVIKWMPLSSIGGGESLADRTLRIFDRRIGYHRVDMSMMLAGASWVIFFSRDLVQGKMLRLMILGAAGLTLFGQLLTGGRTGYGTWVLLGLLFGFYRYRKILLMMPVVGLIVLMALPSVSSRLLEGFSSDSHIDGNHRLEGHERVDTGEPHWYTVTAGRVVAWPYVIEKIGEAPIFGHGRQAMKSTGIATMLYVEFREIFPHPHNAFLELWLDNGIVGFIPVVLFYYLLMINALRMFINPANTSEQVVSGMILSLVGANLVASIGAQSFYPREGVVGMWCSMGLFLRVYTDKLIREGRHPQLSKTRYA